MNVTRELVPYDRKKENPDAGRATTYRGLFRETMDLLVPAVARLCKDHIAKLGGQGRGAPSLGRTDVIESAPELKSHLAALLRPEGETALEILFDCVDQLVEDGAVPRRVVRRAEAPDAWGGG